MAFLPLTCLMRTIELQFLMPKPRVVLTNKEQIQSVHKNLGELLSFLEKENNNNNCAELEDLTVRIKEVCVKAEDAIEAELSLKSLRRVVEDIEELMEIKRRTDHLIVNNNNNNLIRVGGGLSSQRANLDDDTPMVGHSEELKKVKGVLIGGGDSPKRRKVVAMVGMGGIGKTTFAKKLYDDPDVKSHFMLRAWTTISQDFNKAQALDDLCRCIMPNSSIFNDRIEGELYSQLRQSLCGQRYLIILDDIWSTEAWDYIQLCFPDDENGSRILLTTRHKHIAEYAIPQDVTTSEYSKHSIDMRFLYPNESWNLFHQKFLFKECLNNNEFETIGRNIVQKCGGLPLTIVVLAGILSTIDKSIDEWKNVETKVNTLVTLDLHEKFARIFTLSYNNLPSHLKCCFLYLGVFHEDCEIPIKKLIRLWIAEGFVDMMSNRRLEEVGGDYLQQLINRSLVMVHGQSFDGKIKSCRMHDLLRDLCVKEANKDNLLCLESTGSPDWFRRSVPLENNRWLSLKVVNPGFHLVVYLNNSRSILCFNMVVNCDREWYLLANSFKKLRVLDLSKINFPLRMPADITDLVFLRYLALSTSKLLNHIPLWRNWNLQTLIISEDDNGARKPPHGIWDLPHLRHLEVYHQVPIDLPKAVHEDLQTLYWLSTSQCTIEVFLRIPNIKELGIIAQGSEASSPPGLSNLHCLNHLEKLRVQGNYHPLPMPPQADFFPQNLKKLTFERTLIPWEAMTTISMLPNLEELKLRNYACVGQEWELQSGGFPKLKFLLISLTNLKEWMAVECFPLLECLLLRNCFEMKEMPEWIADIYTLKLIKLEYCFDSLLRSAKRIQKEQLDYYGVDINVLESNTRPDKDHDETEDPDGLTSLWFEARRLWIVWGNDPRYWIWKWDSCGYEVAVLEKVSWFEIRITFDIRCLCKMTRFSAYMIFKLEIGSFRDVNTALTGVRYEKDKTLYGWMRGENRHSQVFLAKMKSDEDCGRFPQNRSDGWMEIKIGDFYISSGNEGNIELQVFHTSDQFWMSGFVLRGIEVRLANQE